jgi:hypothetical protein
MEGTDAVAAIKLPLVQAVGNVTPAGAVTVTPATAMGPRLLMVTVMGTMSPDLAGALAVKVVDAATLRTPSFTGKGVDAVPLTTSRDVEFFPEALA